MRLLLLFFVLLAAPSLFGQVKVSRKHVQIVKSTRHKWAPGMVQQNSQPAGGMIYEIDLKMKKKGAIQFHQFILTDQSLGVEITRGSERNVISSLNKGDRITLVARTDLKNPPSAVESDWSEVIAREKQKAAWIAYSYKGKKYLAAVAVINEKTSDR